MTEDATKPGIGERYRRAMQTSNMRVEARCTGDADLLIAAGWADSLGILLYRLAGEYDQVAQDVRRTAADDLTAMVLILIHLKSLGPAKEAMALFAINLATREKVMLTDKEVMTLTGRAISAWLDPNCHKCEGRGKSGGYDGEKQYQCRSCNGTGLSRSAIGRDDEERWFVGRLLAIMDNKIAQADRQLRYLTNGR